MWRKAPKAKKPFHPRLWTGTVRALPAKRSSGQFWAPFSLGVRTAHAFAFEEEAIVPQARVEIVALTDDLSISNTSGKPLASTMTDSKGRWCTIVPETTRPGPRTMIRATKHSWRLRQLAMHQHDLSVNAQTEALFQFLKHKQVRASALSPALFLNVRTLSDTAAGLLAQIKPTSTMTQGELVARVLDVYKKDARLKVALKRAASAEDKPE